MNEMMMSNLARYVDSSRIVPDVELKDYTTFRVGGPAEIMVTVNTEEELENVIRYLGKCQKDYFILGNGSNLLVSDSGYSGVVVKLSGELTNIDVEGDTITAGGGAPLSKVCKAALDNSLTGMEFAYGIPGTVGGAIVMNAGAYDGDMSMVVEEAWAVTNQGERIYVAPHSLKFGYRTSAVRKAGLTIYKVVYKLKKGNKEEICNKMKDLLSRRMEKQPLDYPSAGSTFKRPEGYFAGKLIEDAGLSGKRVGGASVSTKHCGFVINDMGATAGDISELIETIQKKVLDDFNVRLETEVIRIGKF